MKLVKFVGKMGIPSQTARHLDRASLERLKVDVPDSLLDENGTLIFGPETNHTIEMSNEASDSLVAALPTEFAIVGEEVVNEQQSLPLTDDAPQRPSRRSQKDKNEDDADSSDDE